MTNRNRLVAYLLLRKEASATRKVMSAVVGAGKGYLGIGKAISKSMAESGVKSELAHQTARVLPYLGLAVGAKSAYESRPGQRVRYGIAKWKHQRQMKKALRQQQRGY
jgi:hypothetical protein